MGESTSSSGLDLPDESITLTNYILDPHKIPFVVKQRCSDDNIDDEEEEVGFINWVPCEHFSVNVGKRQIAEYVRTWNMPSCWIYSLDFLGSVEELDCTLYHYQACFSCPTPRTPILGTASVFFTMDVSRSKDQSLPVDTHFVVESNRLVHKPGRGQFREKWLSDVIKSKSALRRQYEL
ncbi:A-kinase anchor protein 14 [Synchiropus splendidus]|uniref:A-kinase anchor protein 14 n=1 Tax=Synchiropus splendidus TaxID=270530 RepID=UPI00237DC269|nr:A-kinase anchor protein 14 [Synchiropus splendidus]